MNNAIERIKAHADKMEGVPHNPQFRADLYDLLAQLSEAQADRDSWEQQASDRANEAIAAMRRAEAAGKERDEAQERLAEIEAQDHVGVYTCQQRRDSFPVFVPGIMLNRWIPTGTKLYAAPVSPAAQVAQCAWHEDEDGVYDTDCGNRWEFTEGGVADNDVKFCPYCGGAVDEHQYNDMPEGE